MDVLKTILTGLFREKSKIGPVQVRHINLLLFAAGVLTLTLMIKNHADIKPILIVAISFIVYLGLLYGGTQGLYLARLGYRQKLYKVWKNSKYLQSYQDYNRDSSEFLNIKWQWLSPTRISTETEITRMINPFREIRNIGVEAQHNFKTKKPWFVDMEAFRRGEIITYPVEETSVANIRYNTSLRIIEIAKNLFDYRNMPRISFENEKFENGRMTFTAVLLQDLAAQAYFDSMIERAQQVFRDNFPTEPGYAWGILARGDGTILIQQQPDVPEVSEERIYTATPRGTTPPPSAPTNPDYEYNTGTPAPEPRPSILPAPPTAPSKPAFPARKAFPGADKNDFNL